MGCGDFPVQGPAAQRELADSPERARAEHQLTLCGTLALTDPRTTILHDCWSPASGDLGILERPGAPHAFGDTATASSSLRYNSSPKAALNPLPTGTFH